MTARCRVLAATVLAGCGRLGFDALPAGGGDGGPGSDATPDVVTVGCTPAMLVCDSFETGPSPLVWMTDTFVGSVALSAAQPNRGARSIHLTTNGISGPTVDPHATLITTNGVIGGVTGVLYARVWMYFEAPHPATEFDQLINFVDGNGDGVSLGTRNGMLASNDYTSGDYRESTTAALPVDRWACLQLAVASGTTATTRVFLDGAEVADLAIPKATPQPAPSRVEIGIQWVGTVNSLPLTFAWMDDVIVDTSPVSCAQ